MVNMNVDTKEKSKWLYAIIILSGISIFSQLNYAFDILITLAYFTVAFLFRKNDDFILIYGVLFVFMPRLFLYQGGISLINIFLIIYVLRMLFTGEKIIVRGTVLVIFILLFIYGIFVIYAQDGKIILLVNYITSIIMLMSLVGKLTNIELLKKFLITLSLASIAGCIYGIVNINSIASTTDKLQLASQALEERFKGVTTDPNYMAVTLLIGLLGVFLIKKKYKLIKVISISTLVYFIFTTISTTALMSLLLILAINLIVQRQPEKLLYFCFIIVAGMMIIISNWDSIYSYLIYSDSFGYFSQRVAGQINDILQGRNSAIASGRLIIAERYWNYFWNQNLFNIIFGGNYCGIYGIGDFVLTFSRERYATHNTQLDILLSLGIFGWMLFAFVAVRSTIYTWKMYFKTNEITYKIMFILKSVLMIFSFSLSFFPGWTVLLFYLLDFKNVRSSGGNINENIDNCR